MQGLERRLAPKSGLTVVVETAFGDCGVDFQAGETYLVYADSDEGSGAFPILIGRSSCVRPPAPAVPDNAPGPRYRTSLTAGRRVSALASIGGYRQGGEHYHRDLDTIRESGDAGSGADNTGDALALTFARPVAPLETRRPVPVRPYYSGVYAPYA